MLRESGIKKASESAGAQVTMSKSQGKIFTSGNVIDDKYVILEFIGKGAFGEVYRAHQLNLQRDVAVKVVSREWLQSLEVDDAEIDTALQRFGREVQAMARVRHPNVLQIYDHGSTLLKKGVEGYPVEFIVMEYIPGETLRQTMSEEGFYPDPELTLEWLEDFFLPVLDGVEAIHVLDIVHRDLKPENVLMDGKTPKIADFGLARSSRLKPVTQSMEVKGTAHYMSPEHFFDFRKADQRADIYSLGKILFEAIAGKIGNGTIPFKTAGLPHADTPFFQKLDKFIQESTAENKEDRIETVGRLRSLISDAIACLKKEQSQKASAKPERFPILKHPGWIWAGIAVAVTSVAVMTLWHLFGQPQKPPGALSPTRIISEPGSEALKPASNKNLAAQKPPVPTVLAEDGATLHFIPGGKVGLPENVWRSSQKTVSVNPFYMDETQVTNHQYVEFLNHNLSQLEVERGVVRQEDEIWLLLGKVWEGYEPIVFQNGRFKVTNATYASFPVLRVTAFGASAYARFYNRRLPTMTEWLHAFGDNDNPQPTKPALEGMEDVSKEIEMGTMHDRMHDQLQTETPNSKTPVPGLTPVIDYHLNQYGIRGLGNDVKEWGLWLTQPTSRDINTEAEYVVLPTTIRRQPWEAFERVGFRCVRPVQMEGGNSQ